MVTSQQANRKLVKLFYSYSHIDEQKRNRLAKHLAILKRLGLIEEWYDRDIDAGEEWRNSIDEHLEAADIILLLVSADFIASDYCWDKEVSRALERHYAETARVIPIIIHPVDWRGAPFGHLQALPKDGKPVTLWRNREEAWANVAEGIRKVAEALPAGLSLKTDTKGPSIIPDVGRRS